MAEESNVYEITQMLNNRQQVQNDMLEAMNGIVSVFKEKYVEKIHEVVNSHQKNASKNPSREIQLLSALKLFTDTKTHGQIDKVMDVLYLTNAAKSITEELAEVSQNSNYSAASTNVTHEDGVYEVDESCELQRKQTEPNAACGIILLMSLLGFI